MSIKTESESVSGAKKTKKAAFSFDRVFGPTSTQAALFDEVSSLVQSSLDGNDVQPLRSHIILFFCICIFGTHFITPLWTMM